MTDILFDSRWIGNHGIGRSAGELQRLLPHLRPFKDERPPSHPLDPLVLSTALWRRKPDLFFSPGYNPPLTSPCPFVFTLYDLNHLHIPENSSAAKRAYYKHIIRPACHKAAFVLTGSEYSRNQIREWAKIREEKIVNVGCGVGPPFCPTGEKYDPGYPYVLYVGGRKPHKNLERLFQAFAASGVRKDVRLVLTGAHDAQMVAQIAKFDLASSVHFLETPHDDELARAYRGAVALAFPSLYEGFGLPALEALACGAPVLTSMVCSLPEVVGDAAILVNPFSVEAIASGLRRLVYDSKLRHQLQTKGPLQAEKFSWDQTAKKTGEILELAAAKNTGRRVGANHD
jgi:glycosyltransferase involved in cell wall biosynthesis